MEEALQSLKDLRQKLQKLSPIPFDLEQELEEIKFYISRRGKSGSENK